jgi:hypothetical protein
MHHNRLLSNKGDIDGDVAFGVQGQGVTCHHASLARCAKYLTAACGLQVCSACQERRLPASGTGPVPKDFVRPTLGLPWNASDLAYGC